MTFVIKKIVGAQTDEVVSLLYKYLRDSRFTARIENHGKKITIHDVRLKESKPYCGNHPYVCEIGGENIKRNYLEGADWVGFNDMINDVLDHLKVSADVASSLVVIRKGNERCIKYVGERGGEWHKEGVYINCIKDENYPNKRVRAEFPEGTPGNSNYLM